MNNSDGFVIVCTIAIILVILYTNHNEAFVDFLQNSINTTKMALTLDNTEEEETGNNFVSNDLSDMNQENILPLDKRNQIDELIDEILLQINQNFKKHLIRVNIERVEEKALEDNTIYFKVFVFVFNWEKESNAKLLIEFSLDQAKKIKVFKVNVVGGRPAVLTSRGGVSTRDEEVGKYKQKVDMNKVEYTTDSTLDKHSFNVAETSVKMVDRNETILNKERIKVGNISTFPERRVLPKWDCNGVNYTDSVKKDSLNGLNHGTRPFTYAPKFMKHNFETCIGDYVWLFDKATDTASRPVGVA